MSRFRLAVISRDLGRYSVCGSDEAFIYEAAADWTVYGTCGERMSSLRLAVITDKITHDLGRALEVAARELKLGLVEVARNVG